MAEPLLVLPNPCSSCPYRKDVPPGVWHETEYVKLLEYSPDPFSDQLPFLGTFLCHQTNATGRETVCKGWLWVERESLAVRLGMMQRDEFAPEEVYRKPQVELYETGAAACAAGLSGIEAPSPAARRLMDRLRKKGAAKR